MLINIILEENEYLASVSVLHEYIRQSLNSTPIFITKMLLVLVFVASTKYLECLNILDGTSGRGPASEPGGREFKSVTDRYPFSLPFQIEI